jgi:hypothetical protein
VDLAGRTGLAWARRRSTWLAVWAIVAALMALGLATDVYGLELEPHVYQGTLRYAEPVTVPPIATIAVIVLFAVLSGVFWRATRWPWLFAGAVLTLMSGAVPAAIAGPALASGAEIVLLGCMLAAERRLSVAPGVAAAPQAPDAEVLVSRAVGE